MPDGPTLDQRRQHAILQLDDFLRCECGAVQIPDAEVKTIRAGAFISGWRLTIQPLQQPRKLNICVDALFPFSSPRFLLVDGPPFMTWPHIETDGMLCLADESATVDGSQPIEMTRQLLVEGAFPLLRASENRSNREDFRAEFYSYWNRTISSGEPPIWSLIGAHGPARRLRIWRGRQFSVVGETEGQVLQWLKNLRGDQTQFDETEASCLLWLDLPPVPEEYPRHSSDVWRMASATGGSEILSELAAKEKGAITVVFGSMSENGPCFGAVKIFNAARTDVIGRSVNSIERGFRTGRVPRRLIAERILKSQNAVSRSKVERADASWIHGRDQDSPQGILGDRRVVIVGCGAVGAPVATQLAMAGVGSQLLLDPEVLTWSNVGRHPLGADSVGYSKAEQLAKKLRTCFPHEKFDSRSEGFGEVVAKEPLLLLNWDLIVCATGIWTVEGTVNAWHRSGMGPSQVIYVWTEPHACAGHAVAVERSSACLQCQFTRLGDAKTNITDWEKSETKHEPACGAVYQPYGPIELSWTTALASALALDCLLGKISTSTHRMWAGPQSLLVAAGGVWNADWIGGRKERAAGGFLEERVWEKDATCPVCN